MVVGCDTRLQVWLTCRWFAAVMLMAAPAGNTHRERERGIRERKEKWVREEGKENGARRGWPGDGSAAAARRWLAGHPRAGIAAPREGKISVAATTVGHPPCAYHTGSISLTSPWMTS